MSGNIAARVKAHVHRDRTAANDNGTPGKGRAKRKKEQEWDEFIEARILTGLIVSDNVLRQLYPIWDDQYIRSPEAIIAAGWIFEYYDQYQRAPRHDVQDIHIAKMRAGAIDEGQGELIEIMLQRANDEHEERGGINEQHLLDQAFGYFRQQQGKEYARELQECYKAGELEEAERLNAEFQPLAASASTDPGQHILLASELLARQPERPPLLLRPWLRAGETNILFGADGVGKTLLTMLIAYALGLEVYDSEDAEVGPFQVKQPAGVLYVDGEMGAAALHERLMSFAWLGRQQHELATMCAPDYQLTTDTTLDLSEPAHQSSLVRWLAAHPEYRVVVLDSLSTLYGLENESDNSEWIRKVQPLLKTLRGMGVAQIILHHAGKNGDLRGASAMRAMPANIFNLRDVPGKAHGQAHFIVSPERRDGGKQRDPKAVFKPFALRFFEAQEGRVEWETTNDASGASDRKDRIKAKLVRGEDSQAQIARDERVTEGYVSQMKGEAKREGYLNKLGNPTKKGRELATQYGVAVPGLDG